MRFLPVCRIVGFTSALLLLASCSSSGSGDAIGGLQTLPPAAGTPAQPQAGTTAPAAGAPSRPPSAGAGAGAPSGVGGAGIGAAGAPAAGTGGSGVAGAPAAGTGAGGAAGAPAAGRGAAGGPAAGAGGGGGAAGGSAAGAGCPNACNIFLTICSGCHGMGGMLGGNLDLTSPNVKMRLSGAKSTSPDCSGRTIVDPAAPANSLVVQKVTEPPCGLKMPPGTELLPDEKACIQAWAANPVCP